jgi:hypothetical protein
MRWFAGWLGVSALLACGCQQRNEVVAGKCSSPPETAPVVSQTSVAAAAEEKPPSDYEVLAVRGDELRGPRVGITHEVGSAEAFAFRRLLEGRGASRVFLQLAQEKRLAAQLYGMCGLYLLSRKDYETRLPRYRDSEQQIYVTDGDETAGISVRQLFARGKGFPSFCCDLAGTGTEAGASAACAKGK